MMNHDERTVALTKMDATIQAFYLQAIAIGNHPFLEFAGVMATYAKTCRRAHEDGIDFTECNRHAGRPLPMASFEVTYLNEKLDCIFDGRLVAHVEPKAGTGPSRDSTECQV